MYGVSFFLQIYFCGWYAMNNGFMVFCVEIQLPQKFASVKNMKLKVENLHSDIYVFGLLYSSLKVLARPIDFGHKFLYSSMVLHINCMFQISSKVVCDRILTLVRDGFLQQVIGPALFQVHTYTTVEPL